MRRLLSAALLVFPTFCLAANADRICVERARTLHSVEWTERGELWGARVVITDPQWQLGAVEWKSGGQGFRGNAIFCEACLDGHIAVADVWLGASNPIDPEEVLSTESLTGWVRGYLFHDVFPSRACPQLRDLSRERIRIKRGTRLYSLARPYGRGIQIRR